MLCLPAAALALTHGVSAGDVTATSAVVWARSSAPAEMVVAYGDGYGRTARASSTQASDLTARASLTGLRPGTSNRYRVHFESGSERSEAVEGSFRTPPAPEVSAPVSFIVAGDLGGHGYCRDEEKGYDVFEAMLSLAPDFFIANGDMIYADSECPVERQDGGRNVPGAFSRVDASDVDWRNEASVREIYLAHWRYNRADPHFQRFLGAVVAYSQWDDHEVLNDFGAGWPSWTAAAERAGYPVLVRAGRDAFFDFHPMADRSRIYRSYRWGRDVELFLLDARSYRSPNDLPDVADNDKTLLGREQREWLLQGLLSSDATWKIVSSDVPLSIPTGSRAELYGRDAFADGTAPDYSSRTGFESELETILRALDQADVANVVFVATDVHFAMSLRYEPDVDGDGDRLLFHELVSGPLSAVRLTPVAPDPTFRPAILYAEGDLFNFSFVRVDGDRLVADVRDDEGGVRFGSRVELEAQR